MKYIIEIKPEYEGTTKGIIVLGIKNNCLCVDELAIEELEELNSDYINEHFGDLQDDAYQKGFKDGKAQREHDDKIEVGDEVEWDNDFTCDRFIVTRIYQPYGKKEQCDGIDDDGDVYRAVLIESLVKTGRHYDIALILEAMKA